MPIHMTLMNADGYAPFHPLLTMKPAPERTFSHWYIGEVEFNRPAVSRTYADNIITAAAHPVISIRILEVLSHRLVWFLRQQHLGMYHRRS